jgi:Tol biopolymer transport system component
MSRRRSSRVGGALSLVIAAGLLGAGAAHAEFPGPNGRIAFSDFYSGQIYAANPDGSGLQQLTHVGKGRAAAFPDWSPNGRRLVFSKFLPDGGARIWTMRADGSHQRRVAGGAGHFLDLGPNYTPSARRIVFTRCRPAGDPCAIRKMRVDGTHDRALTPFRAHEADLHASVSSTGRIAFARYSTAGFVVRVVVTRADGSHARAVTPPRLEGGAPEWSPDGRRIAFTSNFAHCCRTDFSLFTMKPDGSDIERVTPDRFPHGDFQPAYSPEGDRIVFGSDRNYPDYCCNDLFVIDPSGAGEQPLNVGLSDAGLVDPDWGTSPLIP